MPSGLMQLVEYGWAETDSSNIEYTLSESYFTDEYIQKLFEDRADKVLVPQPRVKDIVEDYNGRTCLKFYFRDICLCIHPRSFESFWIIMNNKSHYCQRWTRSGILELIYKYEVKCIETHWDGVKLF